MGQVGILKLHLLPQPSLLEVHDPTHSSSSPYQLHNLQHTPKRPTNQAASSRQAGSSRQAASSQQQAACSKQQAQAEFRMQAEHICGSIKR